MFTYLLAMFLCSLSVFGQDVKTDSVFISVMDSVEIDTDSLDVIVNRLQTSDSLNHSNILMPVDSQQISKIFEKKRWLPDPKKAMWLAIAIPGGGQIYNRKYWKLPIIYGGFVGCMYALTWNGSMYRDYSQAYLDIMDNNPNSDSYKNFVPPSYDIESNLEYFKNVFKRRKDMYRRYRDLSIFCMIGVYLISIVDAYIDAEMSTFDISRDLSMKVRPTIINDSRFPSQSVFGNNSYGLQCSISF